MKVRQKNLSYRISRYGLGRVQKIVRLLSMGRKKETITGKGRLNNEITTLLFRKLQEVGIKTHFVEKLSETEQLVKKVSIIPLEVVTRNVIAGSLSKRLEWKRELYLQNRS